MRRHERAFFIRYGIGGPLVAVAAAVMAGCIAWLCGVPA